MVKLYTGGTTPTASWIDSSRAANNRIVEFVFSGGVFQGRFINDGYASTLPWVTVSGGQALGIASITLGGPVSVPASTTAAAGLNTAHGVAPTAPVNGDIWTTTAGMFCRINGVTKTVTLT